VPRLRLPPEIEAVLRDYYTCEFTTVDRAGAPVTWPTVPFFDEEDGCIIVTASIAFPAKALNAGRDRRVALLYSDPTGSGLEDSPAVLVQGDASVSEVLEPTHQTLAMLRLSVRRQPDSRRFLGSRLARRLFGFYFQRLAITVRPRRITIWPHRDFGAAPTDIEVVGVG
jgi:hypothetical protein